MRYVVLFWLFFCCCLIAPQADAGNGLTQDARPISAPDGALAQQLFETSRPLTVLREDAAVPGWSVRDGDRLLGYIGSTWELAESTGYSGRPLDVLVAISSDAKIAGAKLMLRPM
jgi:NosR/NirI family nitrite reductase transcriptional regulator